MCIRDRAITNVDGLDTLEVLKVCVGYRCGSQRFEHVPSDAQTLAECVPVYEDFPGWRTDTSAVRAWGKLPPKCRQYLKVISELTGARLRIASVGPGREQTMFL